MPPNKQHERVNLILMASAFLSLFNVMVFLIYWSTVIDNEKIIFLKSWTTEKSVTKGKNFIIYGIRVRCRLKKLCLTRKSSQKPSLPLYLPYHSRVWNKRTPRFINFWNLFQGLWSYYGLKTLKFYHTSLHILRGYYSFCQFFQRLH